MRVVQPARSSDDGYRAGLVPGVKSSADAVRLAEELAFSAARLAELAADPPGLYAEVAAEPDREEATWLAFLIAYLSPLSEVEGSDPFAAIRAVRTPWSTGELPDLGEVATGPRSAHDPAGGDRTLAAYRAWGARAGSQEYAFTGEQSWPPERRFARVFERLALPGLHRAARFDLLTALGRLGLYDLRADSLHLGTGDATEVAAKRVFAIGDRAVLEHRATDLAGAAGVPLDALDLAFVNWASPGDRITLGSRATPDAAIRDSTLAALGVTAPARV